jgi:hypothetical protein
MGRVPTRDVSHQHRLVTSQNSKAIIDIAVQPFATPRRSGCFLLTHSITGKNNSNGKSSLLLRALPSFRRRRQLFTAILGCSVSVSVIWPCNQAPRRFLPDSPTDDACVASRAVRIIRFDPAGLLAELFDPIPDIATHLLPLGPLTLSAQSPSRLEPNRTAWLNRIATAAHHVVRHSVVAA